MNLHAMHIHTCTCNDTCLQTQCLCLSFFHTYNSILLEYVLIVHIVYLQDFPLSLLPVKGPLIDR